MKAIIAYYPKKVSCVSAFHNFQHSQTSLTCLPVQECLDWLLEEEEDDGPVGGGYEEGHHAAGHQVHGLRVPVMVIKQVFRRHNDDGFIHYLLPYIGDLHDDWEIEKVTSIICTLWYLYCWLYRVLFGGRVEGLLKMMTGLPFPIKCVSNISKYYYICKYVNRTIGHWVLFVSVRRAQKWYFKIYIILKQILLLF